MFQKWIRVLLILGILFSYFPAMSFQHCPMGSHEGSHHDGNHHGGGHKGDGKSDCGYIFHCPITFNLRFSELVILNTDKLVSVSSSITFGDFRFPIFHPPEERV